MKIERYTKAFPRLKVDLSIKKWVTFYLKFMF